MEKGLRTRVVLYARVSLADLRLENQIDPMTRYCELNDFEIVATCSDCLTGTNDRRPGLKKALRSLEAGVADVLLVYSLDRLGRNLRDLVRLVDEARSWGKGVIVMRESLDLRKENPQGQLFLHLFSAFAQYEASLISHRTKNALAVAKLRGTQLGRPRKVTPEVEAEIIKQRTAGTPIRQIARSHPTVSRASIQSVLKRHRAAGGANGQS